ncbi:MAG: alpha/beta hydrolase [Clostridia bacterium]|nr:alpha/beta hydrolase [Clostridia bacterium]
MNIEINGLKTCYTEEDGEHVVLFLHGWGQDQNSLLCLRKEMARFGIDYGYLALDLWGFGQSQTPIEVWGVEDYARSVSILTDKLFPDRKLVVVGHSFGGRVAVCFAADYPQKVEKLILLASAGVKNRSFRVKARIFRYKLLKRLSPEKARIFAERRASADYNAANGSLKQILVKTVNQSILPFADRVVAPTLLVYGKQDTQTPPKVGKRLSKHIKNSHLILLDNADHFAFASRADVFAQIIACFLE